MRKPCSRIPCSSLVGFALNLGFYALVNLAPEHHHDSEGDNHDNNGDHDKYDKDNNGADGDDDDTVDDMCGHNATKMLELTMVDTHWRAVMCWRTLLKT